MLTVTGKTHRGIVRSQNQDIVAVGIVSDSLCYALVCDGMGGENAGDVASRLCAQTISAQLETALKAQSFSPEHLPAILKSAVSAANVRIFQEAQIAEQYAGMGTTLVLAVVTGSRAFLCHVGDSRIYLLDQSTLKQLTKDHSMVQMLVDKGELTPEEAESHPQKHFITKAVGIAARIDPDLQEITLSQGQTLLLCSDGLSNYFTNPAETTQLLETARKEHSTHSLIDYALESGGADNITAALIFSE